jgi:hypothetical protein
MNIMKKVDDPKNPSVAVIEPIKKTLIKFDSKKKKKKII